ncbi:MAG TPA: hypothetical protein ENG65_05990, partial [Candidatus Bathyarchaeota archaeon]|nr:hypothetical protein [Candidatus Bathyarchaeota archaeon]
DEDVIVKPRNSKPLYEYFFENLSMIPDEKHYLVVDRETDTAIGLLDEAFVAEYGRPGVKFVIRGSPWKIMNVIGDKIYVRPLNDPTGAIPSWVGEEIPVPYEVAQEVGEIRRFVEEKMKRGLSPEEIAEKLSQRYPASKETILSAINETVDMIRNGMPVPTDKRITIEEWEEYIILHTHFGSLTNRALAQLLGHLITERTGYTVATQHDPYRILIQWAGEVRGKSIIQIIDEIKDSPSGYVREALTRACVRTGIFKRRLIHVARRFGALKKRVDLSSVSLQSLIRSFEGTVIYEEALKEVFAKDLDLKGLIRVFQRISDGDISVVQLRVYGQPSSLARLGIEKVSMKTDLIPPEKMKRILLESARARLLNETRTFICVSCWDYIDSIRIDDLPLKPKCPRCGSNRLGMLRVDEGEAYTLIDKKGQRLRKSERRLRDEAVQTANLISNYGKAAAIVLSGRGLRISDAREILKREKEISDRLFDLILEAERNALKRRFL